MGVLGRHQHWVTAMLARLNEYVPFSNHGFGFLGGMCQTSRAFLVRVFLQWVITNDHISFTTSQTLGTLNTSLPKYAMLAIRDII